MGAPSLVPGFDPSQDLVKWALLPSAGDGKSFGKHREFWSWAAALSLWHYQKIKIKKKKPKNTKKYKKKSTPKIPKNTHWRGLNICGMPQFLLKSWQLLCGTGKNSCSSLSSSSGWGDGKPTWVLVLSFSNTSRDSNTWLLCKAGEAPGAEIWDFGMFFPRENGEGDQNWAQLWPQPQAGKSDKNTEQIKKKSQLGSRSCLVYLGLPLGSKSKFSVSVSKPGLKPKLCLFPGLSCLRLQLKMLLLLQQISLIPCSN